jgi:hypothetical protein
MILLIQPLAILPTRSRYVFGDMPHRFLEMRPGMVNGRHWHEPVARRWRAIPAISPTSLRIRAERDRSAGQGRGSLDLLAAIAPEETPFLLNTAQHRAGAVRLARRTTGVDERTAVDLSRYYGNEMLKGIR